MTRQYPSPSLPAPVRSLAKVDIGGDGVRVMKVKVAADQVLQRSSGWRELLEKRMQAVSDPEDEGLYRKRLADDFADQMASDRAFIECQQTIGPRLGEIYERFVLTRVDPDEAIPEYEKALEIEPTNGYYYIRLEAAKAQVQKSP